jgi:hypothetical protein
LKGEKLRSISFLARNNEYRMLNVEHLLPVTNYSTGWTYNLPLKTYNFPAPLYEVSDFVLFMFFRAFGPGG